MPVQRGPSLHQQRLKIEQRIHWVGAEPEAPADVICRYSMRFVTRILRYANYAFFIVAFLVIIAMFLGFFSSLHSEERSAETSSVSSKLFYIYDLPSEDVNVLPKIFNHHRLSFQAQFLENDGVGILVDKDMGMYHTHQYSLFPLFYQRLLESKYRTLDPAKASQFFIPYDLGMDASTRSSDGALAQTNCPRVQSVMSHVKASPYFQRKQGADHFMLHSINQMMVYYANNVCAEMYKLCFNCTKLSIDAYPPGVFSHLDARPHMSHNWVSIPFPSNYHFSDSVAIPPWSKGNRHGLYARKKYQRERPFALSFMGSAQVTAKQQRLLRVELIEACKAIPEKCLLVVLGGHESHENTFQAAAAKERKEKEDSNNPYSRARLCLTPGGDFPTRKGFFDALLSGCVPVIFEQTAALTQWPLHWTVPREGLGLAVNPLLGGGVKIPRAGGLRGDSVGHTDTDDTAPGVEHLASSCVVYVPRDVAMRNMSQTLEYLVGLSEEADYMAHMTRCIARVGFQMQYSMPDKYNTKKNVVRPRDAVNVVLDYLLAK